MARSIAQTGKPDAGYEWLRRLDANTREYVLEPDDSLPEARPAGRRRSRCGTCRTSRRSQQRTQEFRSSTSIPTSGTPLLVDGIAIVRGSKHPTEAKKYYEYVTTPEAMIAAAEHSSAFPRATTFRVSQLPAMDSRRDGEDQADAGGSRSDGRAPRRVDEVLGREHQEPRTAAVTAAPKARGGECSGGALALNGVTRRFGEYTAVDNVSFEVGPGELLALVGASGSGKTTTLRIAAGYESPDSGTRHARRRGHHRAFRRERRGFGMVFQHYALFPHMPVEENVAFGLEARGVGKAERLAKARAALASVGLEGAGGARDSVALGRRAAASRARPRARDRAARAAARRAAVQSRSDAAPGDARRSARDAAGASACRRCS